MKKKIALLLCLMMLVPTVVACSSDSDSGTETTKADTAAAETTTAETTTTEDPYKPKVPEDVDFKGEEFKVLIPSWSLYTDYYFTDETNGDTMNDTIYERTKLVEEAINVDITFNKDLTYSQVYGTLAPLVLAGDDVYDLAFTHNSSGFSS
nr:hypothetical protein [Clostridia bacterium]